VIASLCSQAGRIEAAVRYCDAGQAVISSRRGEVPFGVESLMGGAYLIIGQPERWAELCRAELQHRRDTAVTIRTVLVIALALWDSGDAAMVAANGLIEAAETTRNPFVLSFALLAYGLACRVASPVRALDALRRGLVIAQESGNRFTESALAQNLGRQAAALGDTASAFDHLTVAIRHYHNSGNVAVMRGPLANLAALFDRLGRYEPAATIIGFAFSPFTAAAFSEITTAIAHLRDVLGEATYESLAHQGEAMTTAAMVTYAYDQIDQARTELEHPS
jgi:tetratricopeptide (TPR) repeat protein